MRCFVTVFAAVAVIGAMAGMLVAAAASEQDPELLFQEGLHKEEGNGDVDGAVRAYTAVLERFESSKPLAARAALRIAGIYNRQDRREDAVAAYKKVVSDFPSSGEAAQAEDRLKALGEAGVAVVVNEMDAELARRIALVELKDADLDTVVAYVRGTAGVNIVVDSRVRPMLYRPAPMQDSAEASGGPSPTVVTGHSGQLVKMVPVTIELRLRDVTVADVLNLATRSLGLDWTPWSGAIYISDQAAIAQIKFQEMRPGPRMGRDEARGVTPDALIDRLYTGRLSPDELGRIAQIERETGRITEQDLARLRKHAAERARQIEEDRAAREAGMRSRMNMMGRLPYEPLQEPPRVESSEPQS